MSLDFMAHLKDASTRFVEVLNETDPGAPVPTCPGWTAADLMWHLGEVQHFWAAIVGQRMDSPEAYKEPQRPTEIVALQDFFARAHHELFTSLENADDSEPAWTWFEGDQSVGFTRRRQAHEALVHRFDAESAAGESRADVDVDLATDGVLELLEWFWSQEPSWATAAYPGPVGLLRASDAQTEWLIEMGTWSGASPTSGTVYEDAPLLRQVADGDPQFEISAPAADLDAWLWNRGSADAISIEGDAARFTALIAEGVD